MRRPGLGLGRLHRVRQSLVPVAVVGSRGVAVLPGNQVPLGEGDDEGAGVAVQRGGAEEVEALIVFLLEFKKKWKEKKRVSEKEAVFFSVDFSVFFFFLTDHRLCASSPTEG